MKNSSKNDEKPPRSPDIIHITLHIDICTSECVCDYSDWPKTHAATQKSNEKTTQLPRKPKTENKPKPNSASPFHTTFSIPFLPLKGLSPYG